MKVLDSINDINNVKLVDTKNILERDEMKEYNFFNKLFKLELKKRKAELKKIQHSYIFNSLNKIVVV